MNKGINKKIGTWVLALGVLVVGGACAIYPAPEEVELTEQNLCEQVGGRWANGGLSGVEMCFPKYEDAGNICTSESQCLGRCVTETRASDAGQCAASIIFGCYSFLDNEGNAAMICVD